MRIKRICSFGSFFGTLLFGAVCLWTVGPAFPASQTPVAGGSGDLTQLSLEELMNLEVTSVSRKEQAAFDAPAALFIITRDDIRRMGVNSLPEVFAFVPGMEVARVSSSTWAIGVRGYNGVLSDKLQVLIDGRSVYTPAFSGVNWDVQDVLLEDVERIEIIRGPGGTLWGANAVNGVINVITRKSQDTKGAMVSIGHGQKERSAVAFRFGEKLGENAFIRVYAKSLTRDQLESVFPFKTSDDWNVERGGFRVDWDLKPESTLTLQGELYRGKTNSWDVLIFPEYPYVFLSDAHRSDAGGHFIGRWSSTTSAGGKYDLQGYIDSFHRDYEVYGERRTTLNLDFQHHVAPRKLHDLVWGVGFRASADQMRSSFQMTFNPEKENNYLFSIFAQDEINWAEGRTKLVGGVKFEHNNWSGLEFLPNLRLSRKLGDRTLVWISAARAVRTPSRELRDSHSTLVLFFDPTTPIGFDLAGSRSVKSEKLHAFEAGARVSVNEHLTLDLAAFSNHYSDLTSGTLSGYFVDPRFTPPLEFFSVSTGNRAHSKTQGIELAADFRPAHWWRVKATASSLSIEQKYQEHSYAFSGVILQAPEDSPKQTYSLWSSMDLGARWELDLAFRHVGKLSSSASTLAYRPEVPSYTEMNARIGFRLSPRIDLALVGQNLLHRKHLEFEDVITITGLTRYNERNIFLKAHFRF